MITYYKYGIARLGRSAEIARHNDSILGPNTVGIEMTKGPLARKCRRNIDPQHVHGGGTSSAIEEAYACSLDPEGTRYVTIRPDQDSFGAMIVLFLRAMGLGRKINFRLIDRIGAVDRYGLHGARSRYESNGKNLDCDIEASAFQSLINSDSLSLEDKIEWGAHIFTDALSHSDLIELGSRLVREPQHYFSLEMDGPVGFVHGPYKQGRSFVNRDCNVGIVFDHNYKGFQGGTHRVSVARKEGYFDRWGFDAWINQQEAGARGISVAELVELMSEWGGNNNLISSSEGFGCETVLDERLIRSGVRMFTENGIVS